MTTYREIIYIILDELKVKSTESNFTEEHIAFLANNYRALLLKQRYSDLKRDISDSNFQSFSVSTLLVPAISGTYDFGEYLRSGITIPRILNFNGLREITDITSVDFWKGDITMVNRDRFRFVGNNPWLQSIIYCSIAPDNYMYFKGSNPQYKYIESFKISSIFENPIEIHKINNPNDDPFDLEFPLESALIPELTNMIIKELAPKVYSPEDKVNDGNDNLSEVRTS